MQVFDDLFQAESQWLLGNGHQWTNMFFFVHVYRVLCVPITWRLFIHWRYLSLSVFHHGSFFIHWPSPHKHLRHSLTWILSMNQDEACVHPLACYYCQGHCFIWQTWFRVPVGSLILLTEPTQQTSQTRSRMASESYKRHLPDKIKTLNRAVFRF
jgi:hypothetical protein